MIIQLSNEILDKFNLKNHNYLDNSKNYDMESGKQEYRLYSYLSSLFNDITILDVGTFKGRSAISLSHNDNNKVI